MQRDEPRGGSLRLSTVCTSDWQEKDQAKQIVVLFEPKF